jgi:hypothetical protein
MIIDINFYDGFAKIVTNYNNNAVVIEWTEEKIFAASIRFDKFCAFCEGCFNFVFFLQSNRFLQKRNHRYFKFNDPILG